MLLAKRQQETEAAGKLSSTGGGLVAWVSTVKIVILLKFLSTINSIFVFLF